MDSTEVVSNEKDISSKMELTGDEKVTDNSTAVAEKENKEKVDFKVVFNKKKFDVTFDLDDTIVMTHILCMFYLRSNKKCFLGSLKSSSCRHN